MKRLNIVRELMNIIADSAIESEWEIDEKTDISSLDIDSLEFVHIFAEIEEKFNIEFELDDMVDTKLLTIDNLADRILELLKKKQG